MMFDRDTINNMYSMRSRAVQGTTIPTEKNRHSTRSILRRKSMAGIQGTPSNMKLDPKKGGLMTQRIKKVYGVESIDVQRILEVAAMEIRRTSINAKLANEKKSVTGEKSKDPLTNPYHPPKKTMPHYKLPTWSNKMA